MYIIQITSPNDRVDFGGLIIVTITTADESRVCITCGVYYDGKFVLKNEREREELLFCELPMMSNSR